MNKSCQPFWLFTFVSVLTTYYHTSIVDGRLQAEQYLDRREYFQKTSTRNKQLCGQHLRYAIATMCKSLGYLGDNPGVNLDISFYLNANDTTFTNSDNATVHDFDDPEEHETQQLGLITAGHSAPRRLPRQVVDECCDRSCKTEGILKYCNLFRHKHVTRRVQSEAETDTQTVHGSLYHATSTDSPSFISQTLQGRRRPWKKTLRRQKSNALNKPEVNLRNSRDTPRDTPCQLIGFIFGWPARAQRRIPKKQLRQAHLFTNRQFTKTSATNPLIEVVSDFGVVALFNLLSSFASASRDAHTVPHFASNAPTTPHQFSKPALFPRLLKVRDTYDRPFLQHGLGHSGAYQAGVEEMQIHRRGDTRYLIQDTLSLFNEDHTHKATGAGVQGEYEIHQTRRHDAQGQSTPKSLSTTEESDTTKHNVYVFPIGTNDEIFGHGHKVMKRHITT